MFGRSDSGASVPLLQLNLRQVAVPQLRQNLKNQKIFAALRAGAAAGCDATVELRLRFSAAAGGELSALVFGIFERSACG